MSRTFEGWIERLSEESGYTYNYLTEMYDLVFRKYGDVDSDRFEIITLNRLWERIETLL